MSSQNVELEARKQVLVAVYEDLILKVGQASELDRLHMSLKYLNLFSKGLQASHAEIFS